MPHLIVKKVDSKKESTFFTITHFPPPERISPPGKLSYPFFVRPV